MSVQPASIDLAYWQHKLETHQWTPQEMEAYRAGRLAGRLESALQVVDGKEARRQGALHSLPTADKDDLYAQGYEAALGAVSDGRLRVDCCTRCQDYTDGELRGLRVETKVIGGLTLSSEGEISPHAWWETVTPTERRLAVVLLRDYPGYATYPDLLAVGGWMEFSSKESDRYHALRVPLSRLRPKLRKAGLRLVFARNYGYRIEVEAEGQTGAVPSRDGGR